MQLTFSIFKHPRRHFGHPPRRTSFFDLVINLPWMSARRSPRRQGEPDPARFRFCFSCSGTIHTPRKSPPRKHRRRLISSLCFGRISLLQSFLPKRPRFPILRLKPWPNPTAPDFFTQTPKKSVSRARPKKNPMLALFQIMCSMRIIIHYYPGTLIVFATDSIVIQSNVFV